MAIINDCCTREKKKDKTSGLFFGKKKPEFNIISVTKAILNYYREKKLCKNL